MKGCVLFFPIVVMAVAAAVLCCPAAGMASDANDYHVMQVAAVISDAAKTPDVTPVGLQVVPAPPSTVGVLAGVVVTKEKIKHSARVKTRGFFRQGVRLNWPCAGGVCRGG